MFVGCVLVRDWRHFYSHNIYLFWLYLYNIYGMLCCTIGTWGKHKFSCILLCYIGASPFDFTLNDSHDTKQDILCGYKQRFIHVIIFICDNHQTNKHTHIYISHTELTYKENIILEYLNYKRNWQFNKHIIRSLVSSCNYLNYKFVFMRLSAFAYISEKQTFIIIFNSHMSHWDGYYC